MSTERKSPVSHRFSLVLLLLTIGAIPSVLVSASWGQESLQPVKLSQEFLYAVRTGEEPNAYLRSLADMDLETLTKSLDSDSKKKAFWINIYNAFIQIKAKENPAMVRDGAADFFKKKWIRIASMELSFDDVEHGILRASYPVQDRKLQVEDVDARIHFSLNCGAVSCPPIAFYSAESIDREMDQATKNFLTTDTKYSPERNKVTVSRMFKWYEGDFGGEKGIIELLKKMGVLPEDVRPEIEYKDYDWTIALENYVE
jgi:hypothetical protein